ncbi:FAD-dependent oxidoreductase [Sporanaerobium hydrogeniformans]|uniref:FAD-dependent oxidoreductase n=1 Tax=Sporanaerobium hydrogeniformans TaxID=3072179 RepID=A0AC61DGN6_9FIRM|nr:FAD-dependent oxidoreductase [Sporanaerobium hydrogeniformans]PHV71841.1 FAD-dependent oxidoreductase [Sporanaerobium hydrogeniformans]
METITKAYEVIVVGGGLSGVCAAIASAREGAKTALVQDRPVLGGNASSEIRMHICGANKHGTRDEARETGILEEILLENKKRNPQHSFSILDTVLWEKVNFQERLTLYLNTRMTEVVVEDHTIKSIRAHQLTTDKDFEFKAKIFIDCTGDATLAYRAGADYRVGREAKSELGETFAPEKSDNRTMGNTLMFRAIDYGKSMPFEKPSWAYTFTEKDLVNRGHSAINNELEHYEIDSGYWWIELGGMEDTIGDAEEIRDELLKTVYGVWDHIKNGGEHGAQNYVLDWVQFLPGKRESRRIEGDYILKEQDLLEGKVFEDAVAYGGWPMDMHPPEGFKYRGPSTNYIQVPIYTIPYRSYYSRNIHNLMMAGRNISASHMAFGSTRVMGTCAIGGQAVGTAAALAIHYGCEPRGVLEYKTELQQKLLKADCFIPGFRNEDKKDKALNAKVKASSQKRGYDATHVINGIARNVEKEMNAWISQELGASGEWIELKLKEQMPIQEVRITFDSDLGTEIMTTLSETVRSNQREQLPETLVKDYEVELLLEDEVIYSKQVKNNYQRHVIHSMANRRANQVRIKIYTTWGNKEASIYEVRIY